MLQFILAIIFYTHELTALRPAEQIAATLPIQNGHLDHPYPQRPQGEASKYNILLAFQLQRAQLERIFHFPSTCGLIRPGTKLLATASPRQRGSTPSTQSQIINLKPPSSSSSEPRLPRTRTNISIDSGGSASLGHNGRSISYESTRSTLPPPPTASKDLWTKPIIRPRTPDSKPKPPSKATQLPTVTL